jgi:hypothetical protein
MKVNKLILFFICVTCFQCQKRNWNDALEKADRRLLYGNDTYGWELVREEHRAWDSEYSIKKIEGDTIKILFFLERNKDKSISIHLYKKRYPCGLDTCYLEMNAQDTVFLYRKNRKKKIFEVGEYAYRFSYFKMDTIESNYYLKHEDSLRRVKGNNLPKLGLKK